VALSTEDWPTIEAKDAEIARLNRDTAPSITEAYAKMRTHADKMTADVGELTQNLDAHRDTQPQWLLLMEIGALDEVLQHMKELIGSTLPPKVPLDMAFNETYDFVTEQIRWRGVRWQELEADYREKMGWGPPEQYRKSRTDPEKSKS